jgi:DNA-binding GntR family transcriptional regulator
MKNRIPDEVLKEMFPKKLNRLQSSDVVYAQLKKMILSGKLKEEQRLRREEFAQIFGVSETVVAGAFSQLKKIGMIIIKPGVGSYVV